MRWSAPTILKRAGAELRGALLLNDSLAVTIYETGQTRVGRAESSSVTLEFIATPRQKRLPNAFVLNTHSGQTINCFRYDGFYEELGFTIPWGYLPATHTGYFLDDAKGIYALSSLQPTSTKFLPFKSLIRFVAPKQPSEVSLMLTSLDKQYQFYVDTLAPSRFRYQCMP